MRFFSLFGSFLMLGAAAALPAGCGQKGPLYLSDNPPPGQKPSAIKSYKPVPYPERDAAETQPAQEK